MRSTVRSLASGIAVVVLLVAGSLSRLMASSDRSQTDPNDQSLVARGKVVYAEQCASCHGANLEGQPNWQKRLANGRLPAPPHDRTGHTWHHSDRQLFEMTKNGTAAMMPGYETDMPAYNDILSDSDIWAVLSFIESTWPADIRERQQRMNQQNP
jgi:mono/diheme cytochrome c family protein